MQHVQAESKLTEKSATNSCHVVLRKPKEQRFREQDEVKCAYGVQLSFPFAFLIVTNVLFSSGDYDEM